jgi:hypothetical protein
MTGRDDLRELHELAAAISDDAHGKRAQRRARALLREQRRAEAELLAPGRRRRQHRLIAGAVVGAVAIGLGIAGVQVHNDAHHHRPRLASVAETVPAYQLASVRAGRQAAADIAAQGRAADLFSCQQWFDSHGLASQLATLPPGWHDEFIKACTNAASTVGSDG